MEKEHDSTENRITSGTGNVFTDLGLPDGEQDMLKINLAHAISITIRKRGMTQAEAADLLGIDQAKVSALTRGKLKGFSADRLFKILMALGLDLDLHISKRWKSGPGRLRVHAAA